MADLRAAAGASLANSQWGASNRGRKTATLSASTEPTTPREPNECLQTELPTDINIIAAYFAREKPPLRVAQALEHVHDAVEKLLATPKPTSTEQAVRQLHKAVRKLSNQVETIRKLLYTSVARHGTHG